jgi:hypothetical protein
MVARLSAGSVQVSAGPLLAAQTQPVFLRNIDRHGLDVGLAILGTDVVFTGSGELFRVTVTAAESLDEITITARGTDNSEQAVELQQPDQPTTPIRFNMAQNYPNPFNPSTQIDFSLPEPGPVQLKIYRLDGQLVRTLVDGPRDRGAHQVIWDGRDDAGHRMSSGVYFYRITTGPYEQTRKMSLVK